MLGIRHIGRSSTKRDALFDRSVGKIRCTLPVANSDCLLLVTTRTQSEHRLEIRIRV